MYAGIDLSLTATGVAIGPDEPRCYLVGQEGITLLSVVEQAKALLALTDGIVQPILTRGVRLAVIEGLDMAQSYGGQIERSVLWWGVVGELYLAGVRVFVAPSGQVKIYATGRGNANKGQMIEAVTRQWPQFDTRGNDNLADAAAMCALACALGGRPLSQVTAPQRRALVLGAVREITEPPPAKQRKTKRNA